MAASIVKGAPAGSVIAGGVVAPQEAPTTIVGDVAPPPGFVKLKPTGTNLSPLTMELRHPGARMLAGDSGIVPVERPGRRPLTAWTAQGLIRMSCPILMDGTSQDSPITGAWRLLESMAEPSGGRMPPLLKVSGQVPRTAGRWLIEARPEMDEQTKLEDSLGRLWRATTDLILVKYVAPDRAHQLDDDDPDREQAGAGSLPQYIFAAKGDTLRSLAARAYGPGGARRWRELGQANGLRDPTRKIEPGTRLRVP